MPAPNPKTPEAKAVKEVKEAREAKEAVEATQRPRFLLIGATRAPSLMSSMLLTTTMLLVLPLAPRTPRSCPPLNAARVSPFLCARDPPAKHRDLDKDPPAAAPEAQEATTIREAAAVAVKEDREATREAAAVAVVGTTDAGFKLDNANADLVSA